MEDVRNTLRHEVFVSAERTGPWQSLEELKKGVASYVNENRLETNVVNISESIYAWARGDSSGVSRAQVTVWFTCPEGKSNPPRKDTFQSDLHPQEGVDQ